MPLTLQRSPAFFPACVSCESQNKGWDIFLIFNLNGIAAATVGSVLNYLLCGCRSLLSPPLAPDLDPWPPFIRGDSDVLDRLD